MHERLEDFSSHFQTAEMSRVYKQKHEKMDLDLMTYILAANYVINDNIAHTRCHAQHHEGWR